MVAAGGKLLSSLSKSTLAALLRQSKMKKKKKTKTNKKKKGALVAKGGAKRKVVRGAKSKKKSAKSARGRGKGTDCAPSTCSPLYVASKLSPKAKLEKAKRVLPLLRTLQDFKPKRNRSILLSHLDDEACEALYEAVANVMLNDRLHPAVRAKLSQLLKRHRRPMEILSDADAEPALKRRHLAQMGGNPLSLILSAAIPILLDLFRAK